MLPHGSDPDSHLLQDPLELLVPPDLSRPGQICAVPGLGMDPSLELIPNPTFCRKDMATPSRACCPSVLISRPRMGRVVLVRIPSCFSKLYVAPRASTSTSQPQHAGRCQIHGYICSGSSVRDHPRGFLGILHSLAFNLLEIFPWGKNRDSNWEFLISHLRSSSAASSPSNLAGMILLAAGWMDKHKD